MPINKEFVAKVVGIDIEPRTGEVFCDDPIVPDVETESPEEDAMSWLKDNIK